MLAWWTEASTCVCARRIHHQSPFSVVLLNLMNVCYFEPHADQAGALSFSVMALDRHFLQLRHAKEMGPLEHELSCDSQIM